MALKYLNGHKKQEHLPLQDPPKFAQIWIFGLKIYHLAALGSDAKNRLWLAFPKLGCARFHFRIFAKLDFGQSIGSGLMRAKVMQNCV
jgi:hypothetical protein